ncbi:hypothetical protein ZWY2020_013990 [Hordeum vulgare]|nr:hypothetical protein ZWY2020_013990 [Hordeum vulgare]
MRGSTGIKEGSNHGAIYLLIHCFTIGINVKLASNSYGSPRPNEYFTESRQGIFLITGRFDSLEQLDEFSRNVCARATKRSSLVLNFLMGLFQRIYILEKYILPFRSSYPTCFIYYHP